MNFSVTKNDLWLKDHPGLQLRVLKFREEMKKLKEKRKRGIRILASVLCLTGDGGVNLDWAEGHDSLHAEGEGVYVICSHFITSTYNCSYILLLHFYFSKKTNFFIKL